jgi:hypothetical protein
MVDILKSLIKQFMPFAQQQMGFDRPPRLFLKNDSNEADNPMGKTGFYDPQNESITIYIGKRHPKDIMRSLSHELMHHTQNCKGEFDNASDLGEQGYAQNDSHLRTMEIQAYQASIVFRDWEDSVKDTIYYEHLQKGDKKMSTKDWKNKELTTLLSEAWGFKFNNLEEFNEFNGEGELQAEEAETEGAEVQEEEVEADAETVEESEEITEEDTEAELNEDEAFAPNHYCIHHGGVNHNGKTEMAEAVQHVSPDENGHISHYDMKLSDGTILENVAAEDIQVTNASLAEGHGGKKHKKMKEQEEIEEGVPEVSADELDKDDVKDGPGDMSIKDGKLVKVTKEQIEALVQKALKEALQNRKG